MNDLIITRLLLIWTLDFNSSKTVGQTSSFWCAGSVIIIIEKREEHPKAVKIGRVSPGKDRSMRTPWSWVIFVGYGKKASPRNATKSARTGINRDNSCLCTPRSYACMRLLMRRVGEILGTLGIVGNATVNEYSTGRSVLMPHLWSSHRSVALGKTF